MQTSENLYAHGLIDGVVPHDEVADILDRALTVLHARGDEVLVDVPNPPVDEIEDVDTWESVTRSRRPDRPGVRRLLKYAATDVIPLNGTGQGELDPGLLIALARFGGSPCIFLGQDRRGQTKAHPLGPGALREARRGMRLAAELHLPLMTVIDTPGRRAVGRGRGGRAGRGDRPLPGRPGHAATRRRCACCSARATAAARSRCCPPTGWSPPSTAGCRRCRPRAPARSCTATSTTPPRWRARQGVRSLDLRRNGIVDRIVAERPDAADEPEEFCARLSDVLRFELAALMQRDSATVTADRAARYRALGRV